MKKIINQQISIACIALLLLLSACKKSNNDSNTKNTATVTLNGTQQITDQVSSKVDSVGGRPYREVIITFDDGSYIQIFLTLSTLPSLPGGLMNLSTDEGQAAGSIVYGAQNNDLYFDPNWNGTGNLIGTGSIRITKNDTNIKRIEGSISDCIATKENSNDKVSIAGSFGVTY